MEPEVDNLLQSHETRLMRHDEIIASFERSTREMESRIIKWMVGLFVAQNVAAVTVITFVLNNAVPKTPPPPQITYQVPALPYAPPK